MKTRSSRGFRAAMWTASIASLASLYGIACSSGESLTPPDAGSPSPEVDAQPIDANVPEPTDAGFVEIEGVACQVTPCVHAIAAGGGAHVCALLSDKTVRCWGANDRGQLGGEASDPGARFSATPLAVAEVSNATQISASGKDLSGTTCARGSDGAATCWGSNSNGQLALGPAHPPADEERHPTPTRIEGLPFVKRVDVAKVSACAVVGDQSEEAAGELYCWGSDDTLQLGRGSPTGGIGSPAPVLMGPRKVVSAAGSLRNGFAVRDTGQLFSWGAGEWLQFSSQPPYKDPLGRRTSVSPSGTPRVISDLAEVTRVSAGTVHACAIAQETVYCWGTNRHRVVGTGSTEDIRLPYPVKIGGSGPMREVSVGTMTSCARSASGAVYCWGEDDRGQLGENEDAGIRFDPKRIDGLSRPAVALATMDQAVCALLVDGSVECWGDNRQGQLGQGTRDDHPHSTPARVRF